MDIIRLRGHHIASLSDHKKTPYKFYRRIIKIYNIETAKTIRDVISNIERDDANIILVKGLDDICDGCVYKTYCANNDKKGLANAMLEKYPKDDKNGYKMLQYVLKDTSDEDAISVDSFIIKELQLEMGKTYKWKELEEKYSEFIRGLFGVRL